MSRHDCREHLPPVVTDGSVAQCPSCEAWWQYLVDEHELGTYRRWRRVRWWQVFALHAVAKEIARVAEYESRLGVEGDARLVAVGVRQEDLDAALDLLVAGATADDIRHITRAWVRGDIRRPR